MNQLNTRGYYVVRAESARRLARNAASPHIAAIHTVMADGYDRTAAEIDRIAVPILPRTQAT